MKKIEQELNNMRRLMNLNEANYAENKISDDPMLAEDGGWRWESGVARSKGNPLISPEHKWETGISRGKGNPLYEGNEDGIIAYHGSNSNFDTFLTDFVGGESAVDHDGPGVYFTTSEEDATHYGKNIYKVRLTPGRIATDNPKEKISRQDMQKLCTMRPDWEMNASDWAENPVIGLRKSVDAIMSEGNPKDIITQVYVEYYFREPLLYVKNAVKLGYDGISSENKEYNLTHYVIYNPKIVEILEVKHLE